MKIKNILLELSQYSELLLKPENMRIIEEYLDGSDPVNVRENNGRIECNFLDIDMNFIVLQIYKDRLMLVRLGDKKVETVRITDEPEVESFISEKRFNGIIFSRVVRTFGPAVTSKGKRVLTDLDEKRCVFTYDRLKEMGVEEATLLELHKRTINYFDACGEAAIITANLCTTFVSRMHYLVRDKNTGRFFVNNCASTNTSLNSEDVSAIYDIVNGNDKVDRIYDLYHGVINERNLYDIHSICLGLLSPDAFDLKELMGITKQEDDLVGFSEDKTDDYLKYIEGFLDDRHGSGEQFVFDGKLTSSQNIRRLLRRRQDEKKASETKA